MNDANKTKQQLIEELETLRQRNAELTAAASASGQDPLTLLENAAVGVLVTRMTDGSILYANTTSAQLFRGVAQDLIGKSSLMFYADPADRIPIVGELQRSGTVRNYEVRFKRLDGDLFWALLSVQVVPFGAESGALLSTISDISERKQAEETQKKYQELFLSSRDGIASVSMEGNILNVNAAFEEIVGYNLKELQQMNFNELTPEKWHTMEMEILTTQVMVKGYAAPYEKEYIHKDGHIFPVELAVYLTRDNKGNPSGFWGFVRDITERKRAEEAIHESQQRLRNILDALPLGMHLYRLEADGRLVFTGANAAADRLLGVDNRIFVGKTIEEAFPPLTQTEVPTRYREAAGEGKPWKTQQIAYDEGQIQGAFEVYAFQISPGEMAAGFLDVTERMRAEAEIRSQRERLQSIAANVPGVVYQFYALSSGELGVTYASERALEVFGIQGNVATFFPEFVAHVHPEDRAAFVASIQQAVAAVSPWHYEGRFVKPSGETLWFSGDSTPTPMPDRVIFNGILLDITERERAEEAIRESETRFRSFIEQSFDGIMVVDEVGKIAECNEAAARFIGVDRSQILGRYHWDVQFEALPESRRTPEIYERMRTMMLHAGQTGQSPTMGRVVEGTYQRPDGTLGSVQQVGFPIQTDKGYLIGTVIRDVTDQKQAQAERERFTTRLSIAAQIAGRVGSILDPDELLRTVIPLIKEQFGLYYVHVYTLDEAARVLNLRAGYGEPGRIMLERGHSIPLDREASLVATAARTAQPVLVNDVRVNPNFMPNPLLPDTKSEVAVPAIAGGKVLGVFDVQHDAVNYFTEADLNVFTTLAAQIANAFRTAALLEQTERQRALYDGILQNLPVGVWAVDNQFNILLVNDTGRTMMGREIKDKDGGAYVESYDVINLETGALYDNTHLPLVKAVTQGGSHIATDAGVRWPDGTVVPMLINAGPLLDPQGKQMGGVVIFADATEQKRAQTEIERLLTETRVRLDISQALVGNLSEDKVLDILIQKAGVFPEARVTLNLIDQHASELTLVLSRAAGFASGLSGATPLGTRFSAKYMPLVYLVGPGKSFVSPNVGSDERIDPMAKQLTLRQGAVSLALLPMAVGGELLGVLTIAAGTENYFDDYKLHLYQTLADQGAAALRTARLRDSVQRSLVETDARLRVNQTLAGMQTESAVLDAMIKVADFYPQAQVLVSLVEEQDGVRFFNTVRSELLASGIPPVLQAGMRYSAVEFPLLTHVTAEADFISNEISTDARFDPGSLALGQQMGVHSFAIFPMVMDAEWVGVLTATAKEPGFFDEHRIYLYRALAEQGAAALQAARLRAELQTSVARFEGFAENTAYGLGMADLKGTILYANTALSRMLGEVSPQAMVGQPIPRYVPEDLHPFFGATVMPALMQEGRWSGELALITVDGKRIPTHEDYFVIRDAQGNPRYIADILTDIADRKMAESRIAEQLFILEISPDFIGSATPDGRGTYINAAGLKMTGYTEEEFYAGVSIATFQPDLPQEAMGSAIQAGMWTGESTIVAKDGRVIPVSQFIATRKDEAGNLLGFYTIARDISERLAMEEERTRLSAVVEATSDFVGIARPDGYGAYFNRGAREMMGLPLDADPADYNIARLTPESEMPKTMNEAIPTAIKEGTWSGESVLRMLDGREIPVLMTIISIKNAAGELQYLANVSRDITALKQAETERARFTTQLSTAAQIAAQITTILDPDELFETVIPLMKERFGLYHVHFYGLEDDTLVLRAGYGRVGKIMKQQGFKIPMNREKSLVVRAAHSGEIVWVNDVTQEEGYLPNLLLPNTKSEVAVPAMIGNEVLGVLDVQADTVNAFTSADLDVFRTLVGQIATAFQNARAFEQQRRAEVAQRDVAERVRAIFEAMTEGITVTNTLGQIEDMNEATLTLHRYDGRDEVLGRSAMELFTRTDWGRASQSVRQALDTGRSVTAEYKMVRKDGSVFDAEQNSALLRDADGNPAGFVSITRDITERKRAEEALQLTRASVDATAAEIFWFAEDGKFTDVNETACQMLGYTREELLTMRLFDIDPDFPAAAMAGIAAQIKSSGSFTLTSRHRTKDGRIFPVEINVYSVQFGEQTHYFVFAQDITERLRIEKEREQFTTQLRTAAEVSTQVGAILNPQELLELVVPLVAERFDLYHVHVYTLDEEAQTLVLRVGSGEAGRIMRERGHAIPLDREQSLVARVARTRKAVVVNDVTKSPDFLPNPLLPATRSELAIPLLVTDRVLGVLDVQDDAPDRFTAGDMDVFTTLAGQIAAAFLTATSYDRVLEIDRLKGEFLANMSHELRTPMNSILGYTEVMLMGIDGELTPEMEEDVQAIFENGQQLLRLINDILDLTKIEAGRMTLTKELVDVAPILEDSRVNNLGLLHKRKTAVEIVIDADDDLPFVMADRVRLGQVLNNLVSNAVKFTEKGFIYLRAHRVGESIVVEVEDTGIGMSKEDQGKIFERFRQVDGSSTRRAEGTGLGLAITRSLVQMHGWELKLTSELGKGTKFSIYIPVENDNAVAG